jgi:hypothetical protein
MAALLEFDVLQAHEALIAPFKPVHGETEPGVPRRGIAAVFPE